MFKVKNNFQFFFNVFKFSSNNTYQHGENVLNKHKETLLKRKKEHIVNYVNELTYRQNHRTS